MRFESVNIRQFFYGMFFFILSLFFVFQAYAEKLNGTRPYQFGKTEQEIIATFPDAEVREKCFVHINSALQCVILKDQNLFGYSGSVTVRFHEDTGLSHKIHFKIVGKDQPDFCGAVFDDLDGRISSLFPRFEKKSVPFGGQDGRLYQNPEGQSINMAHTSVGQNCAFSLNIHDSQ